MLAFYFLDDLKGKLVSTLLLIFIILKYIYTYLFKSLKSYLRIKYLGYSTDVHVLNIIIILGHLDI